MIAIRHETGEYRLTHETFGCFLLTRKADGASAFFQDEDADLWDRNMSALETIKAWAPGNSLDQSFNFLCDGYAEVLEVA